MTNMSTDRDTITSPVGTAYFVHVAEPNVVKRVDKKTGKEVERERYELTLVFDEGEDLSEIEGLVQRTAQTSDKWPSSDAPAVLKKQAALAAAQSEVNNIDASRSVGPILAEDSEPGKYFPASSRRVALTTNIRPGVVVSFRQTETGRADSARKDEVYSGMRCRVRISAYTFANEQRGVGLNLGHIQVVDATTPRLGGKAEDIADAFEPDKNAETVNSLDEAAKAAEANALV